MSHPAEDRGEAAILCYMLGRVGDAARGAVRRHRSLRQNLARSRKVGPHLETGIAYQNLAQRRDAAAERAVLSHNDHAT